MNVHHIVAISYYELRMHWRRRAILVTTISMIALFTIFAFVLSQPEARQQLDTLTQSSPFTQSTINIVPLFWGLTYFTIQVLFSPIVADAIPLDRQLGIRELMDTLPLSYSSYLIGKLLGMIISLLIVVIVSMTSLGLICRIILGPIDTASFFQMALLGALPLSILNPSISLLISAGQPTRRRAALIGAGISILCMGLFANMVTLLLQGQNNSVLDWLNLARPAIFRFFLPTSIGGTLPALNTSEGQALLTAIILGIVQIAILGVGVWWWQRQQDLRI